MFVKLEQCIKYGKPFLIENVEEWVDPILDSVFQKDVYKKGLYFMIKLGDMEVQYNQDFKMFITSRMANPHLQPEIVIKVGIYSWGLLIWIAKSIYEYITRGIAVR